jgi:hypothetical protein
MSQDLKYLKAKDHVEAVKGFYIHLLVYVCVNAGLIGINIATKSDWWAQWPLLGWGVGVLGHYIGVFMPFQLFSRDWEKRMIKEQMAKTDSSAGPIQSDPKQGGETHV